jgi:hypothetical protein
VAITCTFIPLAKILYREIQEIKAIRAEEAAKNAN